MLAEKVRPALFDLGLDDEQEARARRLHESSIVADLLFQGPFGPSDFTDRMSQRLKARHEGGQDLKDLALHAPLLPVRGALDGECPEFRDRWQASGLTFCNREVEVSDQNIFATTFGLAQRQFDGFDWMVKALRAEDVRRAKAEGKVAGLVSTQLGYGPFPDLEVLGAAYDLGLRMSQLTYNSKNTIGVGCTEPTDGGLSDFGVSVVRRMNELGIIVDTAHCGRQTTLDACRLSSAPVVASHTAAAGVYKHDRCKSDEELRALAETGGVVGIVVVPFLLTDAARPDLQTWLDHVRYVADLVGAQHVGIGTDWPMQAPSWALTLFNQAIEGAGFRREHKVDLHSSLGGFESYADTPNLTRALVAGGFSDEETAGILGGNFLRVFEEVCG